MTAGSHHYAARLVWSGNLGSGTSDYASYGRRHRVVVAGKPDLVATADPTFRGEADTHNPEELFLAAIAGCHMLAYLALCARSGVRVVSYEDDVQGTLLLHPQGGGRFETVVLQPRVGIDDPGKTALALRLHATAHDRCFIASSCRVPIRHDATVHVVTAHAVIGRTA